MIPTRQYCYTDYHDLNLDFLLRQFQQYEIDIDELRRRIKALEDWRTDVIDPDMITIKGDIVNIKANIIEINTKITTLANNSKTYIIDQISEHSYRVIEGTVTGNEISNYNLFKNEILANSASTLGEKNINLFFNTQSSLGLIKANYRFDNDKLIISVYENLEPDSSYYASVYTYIFSITGSGITLNTSTHSWGYLNHINTLNISNVSTFEDTDIVNLADDYPYYINVLIPGCSTDSIFELFIVNGSDFDDISDYVCDYVRTNNGSVDIFVKANILPMPSLNFKYKITGG